MDYLKLFNGLKTRTGMYLAGETYAEAAAFVAGCDAGNSYGLLHGFSEWLIVRLNGYNNLHWSALVLHLAFPDESVTTENLIHLKEKNQIAIDVLCDALVEFLAERDAPGGLAKIFERYITWLHSQWWYKSSSRDPGRKRRVPKKK